MNLTLFLNHRCNLACAYCYNGRKFDRAMPLETAQRAVDFGLARSRGRLALWFFGGEPMLEVERIERILEYARAASAERRVQLLPFICTNGSLLDDRRLRLLRDHHFGVQVSMDGCPAAQDATRRYASGRSSARRVEANLRRLLEAGMRPRLVCVVDPRNVGFLPESYDWLVSLGLRDLYLTPNLMGAWDDAACAAFERALEATADRWAASLRQGLEVLLEPFHSKIALRIRKAPLPEVCEFGRESIAVSPLGRLYPCERLVREDDDERMCIGDLTQGLDTRKRDALVRAQAEADAECEACELTVRCSHHCGCAKWETTGDLKTVSPLFCWSQRRFIAAADRVAQTLHAERAPAFMRRFYGAGSGSGAR